LDNLHRRHQSIDPLIIQSTISRSLEPFVQICSSGFFHAEYAGSSLVEHFQEGDVEVCGVCTES
jgi:hypothetical protein